MPCGAYSYCLGNIGGVCKVWQPEGSHNGIAAVLKTAARKGFRVRISGLPLNLMPLG